MTQPQTHPHAQQPPAQQPWSTFPGPSQGAAPYAPFPASAPVPPRRSRTGLVVGAVAGGVAVLGLAGGALLLFAPRTLDADEVAREISASTAQQAGMAPTDVECPADVTAEAGGVFTCTARLDGQPVSYTVRQRDDEGSIRFELDTDFVIMERVERAVAEQVAADHELDVGAVCDAGGRTLVVNGAGLPFPCTVTNLADPADSITVTATVDPDGVVSYTAG